MSDARDDAVIAHFRDAVREAAAHGRTLRLRGGGSKDFYGQSLEGEPLDTRVYAGVVSYEPSELVITARCGTSLAEIERLLAAQGQMLAFEPPHFGDAATLGGAVAAGLSGPRRMAAGALRDFVLGVKLLDGTGQVLSFGGQVMKNVAGYDVSRLMAGSLGVLALILEVSLKVLPRPASETTLAFEFSEAQAIETLNRWGGQPLPISASLWQDGRLRLRLSGARAAVAGACAKLGGERVDEGEADELWRAVREQTLAFFRSSLPLWRLSLPATAAPLGLPGETLIEWGGALRWVATDADARLLREVASRAGGHATLFRGGDRSVGVFTPLAPELARIYRALKHEFDPHRVFNRGRMYADL